MCERFSCVEFSASISSRPLLRQTTGILLKVPFFGGEGEKAQIGDWITELMLLRASGASFGGPGRRDRITSACQKWVSPRPSPASRRVPACTPMNRRYLALLRDGASFHGIDKRYQSWLATLPSVPSKDAEAFPERTNTPMKALIDRILLVTTTAAVAAAIVSSGFVLG